MIIWSACLFTGNALLKVGQTQQKLGDCERDFVTRSTNEYLSPLKSFLDNDIKTIAVSDQAYEIYYLKAWGVVCHILWQFGHSISLPLYKSSLMVCPDLSALTQHALVILASSF